MAGGESDGRRTSRVREERRKLGETKSSREQILIFQYCLRSMGGLGDDGDCSLRLGRRVHLFYLRSQLILPAKDKEKL